MSKSHKLYTAIIVGTIASVLAYIPFSQNMETPLIYMVAANAIPLPLHYFGASYYVKIYRDLQTGDGLDTLLGSSQILGSFIYHSNIDHDQ